MLLSKNVNKEEFKSIDLAIQEIANSVSHKDKINGKTHLHYKYPAGFSPEFPSAVTRAFTKPGDIILDPFMGGGTSLIEANNLGRHAIGIDVNELAVFSAMLKTLKLNPIAVAELEVWLNDFIHMDKRKLKDVPDTYKDYFRELPKNLSNTIYYLVDSVENLRFFSSQIFARGVVLRSAQLILDNKKFDPTLTSFMEKLENNFDLMLEQTLAHNQTIKHLKNIQTQIIHGNCTDEKVVRAALENNNRIKAVVTSPPYPGVHVLYNRWQFRGRREISLPYFIIGSKQNLAPSFFTLGNRSTQAGIDKYFASIKSVFSNIGNHLEKGTPVVQLVAFNDKKVQLERFLQSMSEAGYTEVRAYNVSTSSDGRIWREVPHRRWYNSLGNSSHSSSEVALIHRKK
ncbi:hypothetical protein DOM21_07170 [Bacteriovorax stolpii]|uniref:DNA methyltransferase n=1 Tax=Bacteriovorax stolpii TaxID=960 RepID=UPI00115A6A66|nr:DNA methyltransferase [Bacteriovorax stolpii]QDK41240.1 hypothetical protein DOM21_07170 [Bacteriovorax stolpii]